MKTNPNCITTLLVICAFSALTAAEVTCALWSEAQGLDALIEKRLARPCSLRPMNRAVSANINIQIQPFTATMKSYAISRGRV